MAVVKNAQWVAFCSLLNIDSQNNDEKGQLAQAIKSDLTNYMFTRFGVTDIELLVNIINSQPVISAVTTSLNHVSSDDAAIRAAVATATA